MNQRKFISCVALFGIFFSSMALSAVNEGESTWSSIEKKIRMRSFSEWMLPAPEGPGFVPNQSGGRLGSTNAFNYVWIGYSVAENTRLVYWQRFLTDLRYDAFGRMDFYSPRFAVRSEKWVSPASNFINTLDLYYQPGWGGVGPSTVFFQLGARSENFYRFSASRFGLSFIGELEFSQHTGAAKGKNPKNLSLLAIPGMSYEISPAVSWQTSFRFTAEHGRDKDNYMLGYFRPFVQNGLGFTASQTVRITAFVNNYLQASQSLKNTWGSLRLTMNIL